ncbi:MAG TPA: mercuric reductase [Candidatus Saccharimonadales bacterium]|jgi:pyruvate/2-oxoglutarate dehydrogenase complex dihydrolipoamide dehydrogenase (E3) component|nr:mercuric reductase [Candidatus Saccharimonadales bacterium]
MTGEDRYEFLVIGSGEAGKHLTWNLAQAGHRTAVVERKYIGGSCPNIACLPSKNVIRSAKANWFARHDMEYGIQTGPVSTDMRGVYNRKRKMVEGQVQFHLDRFKATGADLIKGEARFISPKTVEVRLNDGGTRKITGDRVFLDLGSRSAIPDVAGLAAAKPMTHVEALDLERLPEHVIVLGGGYVGLELAQALRRFGSAVTVIERASQIAAAEDSDVAQAIMQNFTGEGIEVFLDTRVNQVDGLSGQKVRVVVENSHGQKKIECTDLLVATGRTPNTQAIGLEKAGIELDARGYIKVNERLETTAPDVWAVGDCAGSPQFTHVAFNDFRVVFDNLNGGKRTTHDRLVPFCMFTDPELARVGLNETEAKKRGIAYRLAKMPMDGVLRAVAIGETRGFVKMLVDTESDRILGFTAFGVEGSEMMAAVQTAILGGLPYTVLRDAIFTHPTAAEGLVYLLASMPAKALQKPA